MYDLGLCISQVARASGLLHYTYHMKGAKGYDESVRGEDSSLGFYELFGMKSSYVDMQIVARLARGLITHIKPQYHEGEISSLLITGVDKDKDEALETLLNQMKIYPWVEETADGTITLSLDNKREINRLGFFIPLEGEETAVGEEALPLASEETAVEPEEAPFNPYAFTLPDTPEDSRPKIVYPKNQKVDPSALLDDVPEVDVWMRQAQDNFDQGLPMEGEEEVTSYRKGVDLSLFKNRYRFYKDAIKAPNGELLSWDEHKEILLAAKHDPEKMKQAVEMSVGLVKMVVDRIIERFGTNEIYDEDDLFQTGMEGLLYGLSRLEGRDDIKPASYLVPCIEGRIRRLVRTHKRILQQPDQVANAVAKYRRAQSMLEREVPRFLMLPRVQQEEEIIKRAGLSRLDARAVLNMLNAKKESFDKEAIDPELSIQGDAEASAEQKDMNRRIVEIFPSLLVREELVLRLRFGILGESRFSDKGTLEQIKEESMQGYESMTKRGSLQNLYDFDLAKDDFDSYNPAEKLFLALIGKIPESWVKSIQYGGGTQDNSSSTSLEDVGALLGVTRERVRQLESKGLRHMKHPSRSRRLRSYLE